MSVAATDSTLHHPTNNGRHILIPIDLSAHAWAALKFTLENIATKDDVLTLFFVADPKSIGEEGKGNTVEFRRDVCEESRRRARAIKNAAKSLL